MTTPTQALFPTALKVVPAPDDELPTDPLIPLPERDTERPSSDRQSALQAAAKGSDAWRLEPRFSFDPVTGHMYLAEPYTAREVDRWGNVIQVGCPVGTELAMPNRATHGSVVRSVLVAKTIQRAHCEAIIWPHNGARERIILVDDEWRTAITQAFVEGDRRRASG